MQEREGLRDYLSSQKWDAYFTATFKNHQRYSATALSLVAKSLLSPRLRPTKSFICAEQHMLGGWHCHGLLQFPKSHWKEKEVVFARATLSPLGFNMVSTTKNTSACAAYLSKYLTKDDAHGDWIMTGRKKFWQGGA